MAKHRLINCEFLNASSFKVNVSNKAKLLYVFMLMNGDDRGFVDSTQDLVNALKTNDDNFTKTENTSLLEDTYEMALQELLEKGYIYEFKDNHLNKVHLIRHWFYHNKYKVGLWTNYRTFFDQVHLENNEYIMGYKKPLKEDNTNESNINQDNVIENKISEERKRELAEKYHLNTDKETEDEWADLPFQVDKKALKKGQK